MVRFALGRDETFRRLYAAHFDPLLGYALRRVDRPEDAADVVAEAFLVAWRRLQDVPEGAEARFWLYGVARRMLANQRRGAQRRAQLGGRLRAELAAGVPDHADRVAARTDVQTLLAALPVADREVLELAAWEGLEPREMAIVLGITTVAARTRLSRARGRVRRLVGERRHDPSGSGHLPSNRTTLAREEGR